MVNVSHTHTHYNITHHGPRTISSKNKQKYSIIKWYKLFSCVYWLSIYFPLNMILIALAFSVFSSECTNIFLIVWCLPPLVDNSSLIVFRSAVLAATMLGRLSTLIVHSSLFLYLNPSLMSHSYIYISLSSPLPLFVFSSRYYNLHFPPHCPNRHSEAYSAASPAVSNSPATDTFTHTYTHTHTLSL